jgi:Mn-containing catalase
VAAQGPDRRGPDEALPLAKDPTDTIPECEPHIARGEHLKLFRFSPADYQEIVAMFNGPRPETGEQLEVVDEALEGFAPNDVPGHPAAFAPDHAPEEIAEIAKALRQKAGLSDEPTGVPANGGRGFKDRAAAVVDRVAPSEPTWLI